MIYNIICINGLSLDPKIETKKKESEEGGEN